MNLTRPGNDDIKPSISKKKSLPYIANILSQIINASFLTGIVPESLKQSIITPIFKSGDKTKFNNYRPISISPYFS